jgi:hypothetical protein
LERIKTIFLCLHLKEHSLDIGVFQWLVYVRCIIVDLRYCYSPILSDEIFKLNVKYSIVQSLKISQSFLLLRWHLLPIWVPVSPRAQVLLSRPRISQLQKFYLFPLKYQNRGIEDGIGMTLNDASLAHFLIRPCIRWGTHCVLFFGSFQKVFPESLFIDVVFVFQFEEFNWRSCEIM